MNELIGIELADEIIDEKTLFDLMQMKRFEIGDESSFSSYGYVEDYYIERKFRPQFLIDVPSDDICFISGAKLTNTELCVPLQKWEPGKCYDNGGCIINDSDELDVVVFMDLMKSNRKSLHWVEYKSQKLVIKMVDTKRALLCKNYACTCSNCQQLFFDEDELIGKELIIIVASEPGFGKSTLLTSVAKKMKAKYPELWLIRIDLSNFAPQTSKPSLGTIDFDASDLEKAIRFIAQMAVPQQRGEFERRLFEKGLQGQFKPCPMIVIMFDGFDEICPTHTNNTITLIRAINQTNVLKIWVTTRTHEKCDLENAFGSPAHILCGWNLNEQKEFYYKYTSYRNLLNVNVLMNILSRIPCLSYCTCPKCHIKGEIQSKLEQGQTINLMEIIELFLEFMSGTVIIDKDPYGFKFNQIPLNLKLLIDLTFDGDDNPGLIFSEDLYDVYSRFINRKFDIFNRDKTMSAIGLPGADAKDTFVGQILREIHQKLAIEQIASNKFEFLNLNDLEKDLQRFGLELIRVGILKENFQFSHKTFAEFFFTEFLTENLNNDIIANYVMNEIMRYRDNYVIIRKFFNGFHKKMMKNTFDKESPVTLQQIISNSIVQANENENIPMQIIQNTAQTLSIQLFNIFTIFTAEIPALLFDTSEYKAVQRILMPECEVSIDSNEFMDILDEENGEQKMMVFINWIGKMYDIETLEKMTLQNTKNNATLFERARGNALSDCFIKFGVDVEKI